MTDNSLEPVIPAPVPRTVAMEVGAGSEITRTISQAITAATNLDKIDEDSTKHLIRFEFNGVIVLVRSDSDPELIYRDWSRALSGYISGVVDPYPNSVLTDEEKAHDDEVEAENERRRQERQAEYEARATAKQNATDAKLAEAPTMEFSDEQAWQEFAEANQDPYGHCVVVFAEQWARLMQARMADGEQLEDIAEETSQEADTEGITGFMYGCAVSTLAATWKYGDKLRRWHNLDTQIGDEGERANESGGVLNPALLNVSVD